MKSVGIKPLQNAIMWQDKRTAAICKERENLNIEIFDWFGSRVNPVFSASKMTWIREEQPDIYEKTYVSFIDRLEIKSYSFWKEVKPLRLHPFLFGSKYPVIFL